MKSICIITSKYPNSVNPTELTFVRELVWAIADLGIECSVISPVPFNIELKKAIKLKKKLIEYTRNNNPVNVYFPRYLGFGQRKISGFNTAQLTLWSFSNVSIKTFKNFKEMPSAVYGHFAAPAGVTASRIGRKFGVHSFFAYGESSSWSIENIGLQKAREELSSIDGVVAVSSKNKNELLRLDLIDNSKIIVCPNSVDRNHFTNRGKLASREKLNLPKDAFIVSFVGHFIERKGISILVDSINQLDDVFGIFAGSGPLVPTGERVLFADRVSHDDLPYFYSASDIFVLPTLNEGCSNAIIEALSCEIPVISSNYSFNDDILDESNSIKVNPLSVNEIKNAIQLYKVEYLGKSIITGKFPDKSNFKSIQARAMVIVDFIHGAIYE
jgi:teichuronic acid biosynthesis glycosyltransferase TuaC